MPDKATIDAAKKDLAEGKSASTAAGEFVKQEMNHIRAGKHGAANTKQAIAIGLSEARRAGIPLGKPKTTSAATRKKAAQDDARGKSDPVTGEDGSTKRGRAVQKGLKKEPKNVASKAALSKQAKSAAKKRTPTARSASAKKAAATRKREGK